MKNDDLPSLHNYTITLLRYYIVTVLTIFPSAPAHPLRSLYLSL